MQGPAVGSRLGHPIAVLKPFASEELPLEAFEPMVRRVMAAPRNSIYMLY
jgi:hypothetical protein